MKKSGKLNPCNNLANHVIYLNKSIQTYKSESYIISKYGIHQRFMGRNWSERKLTVTHVFGIGMVF